MVYKIGNIADLEELPQLEDTALELLYHYARVLTVEYGENRNIEEDDDGRRHANGAEGVGSNPIHTAISSIGIYHICTVKNG